MAEGYTNTTNNYDNDYIDSYGDNHNHNTNHTDYRADYHADYHIENDADNMNESENMHYDIAVEYDTTYIALKEIIDTMNKYINDTLMIWNTEIIPFMDSNDCYVLDKLNNNDCDKFIDFMKTQKTYTLMTIAKHRLEQRLEYLKNNF